jgi:hypothetical protein
MSQHTTVFTGLSDNPLEALSRSCLRSTMPTTMRNATTFPASNTNDLDTATLPSSPPVPFELAASAHKLMKQLLVLPPFCYIAYTWANPAVKVGASILPGKLVYLLIVTIFFKLLLLFLHIPFCSEAERTFTFETPLISPYGNLDQICPKRYHALLRDFCTPSEEFSEECRCLQTFPIP